MAIPLSPKLDWSLANPLWAQTLNPILSNPMNGTSILTNISLIDGVNIINHGLGRTMLGWSVVDITGAAAVYRSAPMNSTTLTLTSSAAVICNIGVF